MSAIRSIRITAALALAVSVALCAGGCTSAIRAEEQKLLRPGALDIPIPGSGATTVKPSAVKYAGREGGYYDKYSVPFLDRYFVQYLWYGVRGCGYGALNADVEPISIDGVAAVRQVVGRVYEANGRIWRLGSSVTAKPLDITPYFRSVKGQQNILAATPSGGLDANKVIGVREIENGLRTMCFQYWVGQSASISLQFYERSVADWIHRLDSQWKITGGSAGMEQIGSNLWTTYTVPLRPKSAEGQIGPSKFYAVDIGDSGYSLMFQLWAAQESLADPASFAALESLFRRILASVRVEPWDTRSQAEYNALVKQALAVQKQECLARAQRHPREKPLPWCVPYLQTEPS